MGVLVCKHINNLSNRKYFFSLLKVCVQSTTSIREQEVFSNTGSAYTANFFRCSSHFFILLVHKPLYDDK